MYSHVLIHYSKNTIYLAFSNEICAKSYVHAMEDLLCCVMSAFLTKKHIYDIMISISLLSTHTLCIRAHIKCHPFYGLFFIFFSLYILCVSLYITIKTFKIIIIKATFQQWNKNIATHIWNELSCHKSRIQMNLKIWHFLLSTNQKKMRKKWIKSNY